MSHNTQFLLLQESTKEKSGKVDSHSSMSSQTSAKDLIAQASPLFTSSTRRNNLTQSVCYFIAKDIQPIDTTNDTGFR